MIVAERQAQTGNTQRLSQAIARRARTHRPHTPSNRTASIGHIAVGMAAARIYASRPRTFASTCSSMILWSGLSLLPDLDVLGFRFGIRYADAWGHRGATHSLAFALGLAVMLGTFAPLARRSMLRTTIVAAAVLCSHAVLDVFTDGGLGCALLWPFDEHRYFAPWNPIPVAPIGLRFFSKHALSIVGTELVLFGPLFVYALWPRRSEERHSDTTH